MKNKFGLIGLVSLLGFWGLHTGEQLFIAFFAFALFFEYLFVIPDELFVENMRKAAMWAFFSNLTITVLATMVISTLDINMSNAFQAGCTFGFSAGIIIFCCSTSFLEWKEKWANRKSEN